MGGSGGNKGPTSPRRRTTRGIRDVGAGSDVGQTKNVCLAIQEDVRLESPKPEVLATLKPGDVLELRAKEGKAPIKAVTREGKAAGSILTSSVETLLRCMDQGYNYVATVQSIKGGMCTVRVTPSKS